ncbi:MAG: plastocyanin [Chloroflexi bacterium]|nr:plastocyanin [Chloroflexota bacterium]
MKRLCQVGALLIAILAIGCAPTAPTSDHPTIAFRYSRFDPGIVRVPAGVPVTFVLKNDDPIGHEWIVGGPEIHAVHRVGTEAVHDSRPEEVSVPAYASRTTTLTFDKAGTYEFICHLPGHEEYGMKGTLVAAGR